MKDCSHLFVTEIYVALLDGYHSEVLQNRAQVRSTAQLWVHSQCWLLQCVTVLSSVIWAPNITFLGGGGSVYDSKTIVAIVKYRNGCRMSDRALTDTQSRNCNETASITVSLSCWNLGIYQLTHRSWCLPISCHCSLVFIHSIELFFVTHNACALH